MSTHTRLFTFPFLLVASLVLGWAGEAVAQSENIDISVDRRSVREDGGAQDIMVTAELRDADAKAKADLQLPLRLVGITARYLNDLFRISLPSLVIKKGERKATGTITITPINNNRIGINKANASADVDTLTITAGTAVDTGKVKMRVNLPIVIDVGGSTGDIFEKGKTAKSYKEKLTNVTGVFYIDLIDDDVFVPNIDLSFSPAKLSKQADATPIEVTAMLEGGALKAQDLKSQLVVSSGSGFLTRDVDYSLRGLGSLTIPKKKIDATTTFTLDPDNKSGTIELNADTIMVEVKKRINSAGKQVRFDIRTEGTINGDNYVHSTKDNVQFAEIVNRNGLMGIGVDFNGDGDIGTGPTSSTGLFGVNLDSEPFNYAASDKLPAGTVLVEKDLGIDFFKDDDLLDTYVVPDGKVLSETGPYLLDGVGDTLLTASQRTQKAFELRIDFNGDGRITPGRTSTSGNHGTEIPNGTVIKRLDSFVIPIVVKPGTITVEDVAVATLKNFTLSPKTIREAAGVTDVTMTVELETALTGSKAVDFQITAGQGTRDVHYEVEVIEGLTIPTGDTKGTAMLRVTPVDNSGANNARTFTVTAKVGTEESQMNEQTFTITDDETLSENITLSVNPSEIKEDAGETTVTVTGTLDGKVLDANATISLVLDEDASGSATRDVDYTAVLRSLTIPRGEITGSTTITITPVNDGKADNDETITLKPLKDDLKNQDDDKITVGPVAIKLKDAAMMDDSSETPADTRWPSFGTAALAFEATVGQAFSAVLPAATGGQGTLMYSVSSNLPLGLSFDAATRTLSGTPTLAGMASVVYTAIDADGDGGVRTFTITVADAAPVTIGVASVMASQSAVRENGETAEIRVTATLSGAAPAAETVRFTIVPPASGAMATRDVDYTATLAGTITIAAGETMGSTTLFLSPIDNASAAGHKHLGVRAAASGGWAQVDIRISDDETPSTSLVLSVTPSAISESAELTEVMVMAALDGKPLAENATVSVSIDAAASSATRDTDYSALFNPTITIAAGSIMGSTRLLIDPVSDGLAEGDETIILNAMLPGLMAGSATLVLTDMDRGMMDDNDGDEDMMIALAFVDGASIPNQNYTAGTAITPLVLPMALGGEGTITYSVSGLPAGLSFDPATRTISGTPEAATDGAVEVTYTAMAGEESVSLMFAITINAMLDFGDLSALFDRFNSGAGKPVPLQAGLNAAARLYLDAPTALPSVGEEFVVDVRLADFVAVKGYGLQIAYDADQLTFVEAQTDQPLGGSAFATPQVLAEAGVLTVATHGDVVSDGELMLRLVFRPTTEIEHTTLEITDNRTWDQALGFNRLALPAPVSVQTRPAVFSLAANYPNPFNPQTTIQYALPQAADVGLTVYNVLGQPVRTLVAEHQSAGRYAVEWDATNDSGQSVSSGMYFYRLQAGGDFLDIKKMLLLK